MSHLVISERINDILVQILDADGNWVVIIGELPNLSVYPMDTPPSRYEIELLCAISSGMLAAVEGRN